MNLNNFQNLTSSFLNESKSSHQKDFLYPEPISTETSNPNTQTTSTNSQNTGFDLNSIMGLMGLMGNKKTDMGQIISQFMGNKMSPNVSSILSLLQKNKKNSTVSSLSVEADNKYPSLDSLKRIEYEDEK